MSCLYNFTALTCSILEDPANGTIDCDTQTVGGTCSYRCNNGYTLRGSINRTCSPSLQWSGRPTVCDPPMCHALSPPTHGFVLFPCSQEEGDSCRVVCAHGYTTNGSSTQTCERNSTDMLVWSEGPVCDSECIYSP